MAESLETRQLLSSLSTHPSASVTGIDTHGNHWTLTLYGPGTLNVVDQNGTAFPGADGNDISTITVSGTVTSESRLVGKLVTEGTGSNSDAGKVFFQQLTIDNTGAYGQLDPALVHPRASTPQNGIAAVDMPDFWLGWTTGNAIATAPKATSNFHSQVIVTPPSPGVPEVVSSTPFSLAGGINAPEGINVLRFGGVDTTYTTPVSSDNPSGGTALTATNQNNEFVINLGPPIVGGTSIIVTQVKTDAGSVIPTNTALNYQDSVTFLVAGRINLFQADEIDTNSPTLVPTQFNRNPTQPQTALLPGGTYLVSDVGGGVTTGQIGDIRIGGNATNFTAFALGTDLVSSGADTPTGPQVSNFFIGGQTQNVILVAPSGSRNVFFGQGMDNVFINTEFIQNLQANRGAVGSAVTVKRNIGNMVMGGDVINTVIQSGYDQNLSAVANTPVTSSTAGGVFNGEAPPTIINRISNSVFNEASYSPLAHGGGAIHGRIAGNVTNSIISVSVDPNPFLPNPSETNTPGQFQNVTKTFPFGAPNNIVLPRGVLSLKVEGEVNNSAIAPGSTTPNPLGLSGPAVAQKDLAFFAKKVSIEHLPVIPPNVPEAPYPFTTPHKGQSALKGLFKKDNSVALPSRPARKK